MKTTLQWLREFVDIDMDVEPFSDLLTMSGLEVEEVVRLGEGLDAIIVGEIVEVTPHPESDTLFVAKVNTGGQTIGLVSSAPNVTVGLKTALALPGTRLPGGMTVEKRKFKGVESAGVLLAEDELGITQDHTGLIELPDTAKPGQAIDTILDVSDYLFDISITPNRSDCLSIIGLARDIAAMLNAPLHIPKITFPEEGDDITSLTSVDVKDKDLCPRYVARVIQDVSIERSPLWMRMRLSALGIRDINNIVDISNYVLLEYGQPLHTFDYNLLEENRIVVKRAKKGETFFTLDAVERTLSDDILMICDGKRPVAIGGIMGGANSEIQDDTDTVLLESAFFHPPSIHQSARYLNLMTEAAYRFERGVDPGGQATAADRATQLMVDLAGGKAAKGIIDEVGSVPVRPTIHLRPERARKIIGFDVTTEETVDIMTRLSMDVKKKKSDLLDVTPPSYRLDLDREIDLIEEVARIKGYDEIPETLPEIAMGHKVRTEHERLARRAFDVMISEGFSEIITYSFIERDTFARLGMENGSSVELKNPMSEEMAVMRTTLIPGIVKVAAGNMNHLNTDLKLFEIARVYTPRKQEKLPDEPYMLSALISGDRYPKQWGREIQPMDFFDLKGTWETLVKRIGVSDVSYDDAGSIPYLDSVESCVIKIGGDIIGVMGKLDENVAERYDLNRTVYVMEVNLTALEKVEKEVITYTSIPRYPPVLRDIAMIVAESVRSRDIVEAVRDATGDIGRDITVFDVYTGRQIDEGKKSLALSVMYQSDERTLTDEEVNTVHSRVIDVLEKTLSVQIR
ncbi:MAG: phenylalanine--tRNA ligase subunit beta [Deltaproteobacteria bacterium]|nr:phenylalanine--tRNA ligase subunit beta [Candidatus Zymogenaceae bacterium]